MRKGLQLGQQHPSRNRRDTARSKFSSSTTPLQLADRKVEKEKGKEDSQIAHGAGVQTIRPTTVCIAGMDQVRRKSEEGHRQH
jgi:hypothetical protein